MSKETRWLGVVPLVAGLLLVLLYHLLTAAEVGKFGQPTDIGGGMLLLLGYLSIAFGVIALVVLALTRGKRR